MLLRWRGDRDRIALVLSRAPSRGACDVECVKICAALSRHYVLTRFSVQQSGVFTDAHALSAGWHGGQFTIPSRRSRMLWPVSCNPAVTRVRPCQRTRDPVVLVRVRIRLLFRACMPQRLKHACPGSLVGQLA